jgi:hypothetical protein
MVTAIVTMLVSSTAIDAQPAHAGQIKPLTVFAMALQRPGRRWVSGGRSLRTPVSFRRRHFGRRTGPPL